MTTQVKISNFYGAHVARPYLLKDEETGRTIADRVDKPSVNESLIEWANQVPYEAGGLLVKAHISLPIVPKARSAHQIFMQVSICI